ncbi:membrane protein [Salmonella enterica subsp. enterica]|nr:membrane protein [Salmonella enterica subsp. enterica] [Salmonella enterica subsp. enterica serovar Menston]
MKLSIDFWEVISLLLSFVGLMFAAGKLLLAQIEKRLNERFEALEAARRESEIGWSRLEREFLEFRADLTAALCPQRRLSSRARPFWKQNWMRYIAK